MGLSRDEIEHLDQLVYTRRRGQARREPVPLRRRASARSTPCAPASSRASVRPRGRPRPGDRLSHARRDPRAWTASAPSATPATRIALEDSEVCVIPFARLEEVSREVRDPAAPVPQGDEPRDRARPRRDDAARDDARRGAAGGVPAQPLAALRRPRLLAVGVPPAHDARGDRQLSRPQARDGQPDLLEVPGSRG